MVRPETEIAPFLALLRELDAIGAPGANWLLFGDKRSDTDFLYREQLDKLQARRVLNRLDTAFNRDQKEKIYMQD